MSSAYEVRLHGVVSRRVLDAIDATIEVRTNTILRGQLRDQAELHGLLARISDLGLELIDVRQIQRDAATPHD